MSAFPHSRFGSDRNHFCYKRVSSHIQIFKKALSEPLKLYKTAKQNEILRDYIAIAFPIVDDLPDFDDANDNKPKEQMIKTLTTNLKAALKMFKKQMS
eukprot:gene11790-5127_t